VFERQQMAKVKKSTMESEYNEFTVLYMQQLIKIASESSKRLLQ